MAQTDTSTYGMYMLMELRTKSPTQEGGEHRAATAIRDEHGRFMPNDVEAFEQWQLDPAHGVIGGQARARAATRDNSGRFAPKGGRQ